MNYPKAFTDLSESDKKVLCHIAYTGYTFSEVLPKTFMNWQRKTRAQSKEIESRLRSHGMITDEYSYFRSNSGVIDMDYLGYALFYMHTEHPEWAGMFMKPQSKTYRQHVCVLMDRMVASLLDREKKLKRGLPLQPLKVPVASDCTYEERNLLFEAFNAILAEEEFAPAFSMLETGVLNRLIMNYSICNIGAGHARTLTFVRRILKERPELTKLISHTISSVCQDAFYSTGEWLFDEFEVSGQDSFLLACKAVLEAYKGNYGEALKYVNASMKERNTYVSMSEKNVYGDSISNYFLVLVYALEGSDASRKKLDMLTRKERIDEDESAAAKVLAYYFRDNSQTILNGTLVSGLSISDGSNNYDKAACQMAYNVARYFSLKDDGKGYTLPDMSPERYASEVAILRHEMSAYVPLSPEEKEHLEQVFGGKPLLTSIHRKQDWELVLEEIYKNEAGSLAAKSNGEQTARGIYIMSSDSEYIVVREQNRLKSGAWGKGRRLSETGYAAGKFQMDDIDKKIHEANRLKGRTSLMPNLTVVIPQLAGTEDRLYCYKKDSAIEYDPVTVVEEKPFIALDKDKDGIHLRTNLPPKVNFTRTVIWNFDEKLLRLTYYPMDAKERQYMRQLTALGTLPLEAEPMLQQVFPALKGKLEIHTDFIEGVEQLEEEDGQALVCIRIIPRGNMFDVTLYVVPLKGGHQSFIPGEGKDIVYDERDGVRYQVKRHKRVEKRNAQVFTDFMDDELDAYGDEEFGDETGPNGTVTLDPECLVELLDYAHEHPENGYVEWPDGEKLRLKVAQPGSWSVSMKSHGGWFDLEGDVKVDDDTVLSIGQLLDMVENSRSRFIQLSDGDYLSITDSLRKQLLKLGSLASVKRGKASIPAVGVALMGSALEGELEVKHTKAVDDLRKKIKASDKIHPDVPDELNGTLRDYQFDGYRWMSKLDSWGAGACLSDDMGLGKTIQAITFILSKRSDGAALVVAPASVVPNWRNEIKRFAPTLTIVVLNEQTDRQKAIEDADCGTVLITTYGLLITQEDALVAKEWGVICLDEAHTIKNRDTKMSGVCMKLQSKHRVILTGTPLQNHLGELWNLFQFVNPGLLGTYEQFQKKFIAPIEAGGNEERRQMLRRMIKPFMLRRTKQEVATELPDKEEITLHVDLSPEEMAVYEVIRRRAKDELEELERTGKKVNMNALAEITRLRMASCSARLAEKSWNGPCSKLDTFTELITELKQNGHRALVFSQFTSFLDMAKKAIEDCKDLKDLKYFYLDGSTPMKKREQMVKAFQKGECDVFIISLKAGGLGLNLTGANYVIHLDPWWNPAIEQQATDRAHRIGQTEKVTVYHLISSNTIEEKILRLHEHKRDLATSLLEGTNDSHKITTGELLEMLGDK